jgi:hypothetical protein
MAKMKRGKFYQKVDRIAQMVQDGKRKEAVAECMKAKRDKGIIFAVVYKKLLVRDEHDKAAWFLKNAVDAVCE